MKGHERDFIASCDLDPEVGSAEVSRALATYRGSGPWHRAEVVLALDRLNEAIAEGFEPLLAKAPWLGRLIGREKRG